VGPHHLLLEPKLGLNHFLIDFTGGVGPHSDSLQSFQPLLRTTVVSTVIPTIISNDVPTVLPTEVPSIAIAGSEWGEVT
jgi:hypothetical protein